ncbi:lipocalin-like domain-containing protein [Alteromonas sp. W364]|uniref:lipocalin-like domain-containing protein n=1 Tax=Alteromonas sp. W364 TaxID=3075610 RepID=UPI0028855258|nr:lipocalin-like domain-containing protein [Alteromonas sp. W364]MDT0628937.1 lipocalin-like domain-containing protein [Alteromonas sp. W364]
MTENHNPRRTTKNAEKSARFIIPIAIFVSVLIIGSALNFTYPSALERDDTKLAEPVYKAAQTPLFGRAVQTEIPSQSLGKKANPDYKIAFPQDHGSHNDFDIEWWYLTANLDGDNGLEYDIQWTLFRFRIPSEEGKVWGNEHTFMAHASVHSGEQHWFTEKFARGGLGIAGVTKQSPFALYIDDWLWQNNLGQRGLLPADLDFSLKLIDPDKINQNVSPSDSSTLSLSLQLKNKGPYILQGDQGYSIKSGSASHASHYYSAPFIDVEGYVQMSGIDTVAVRVKGQAWFDQEWTSQLLDQNTLGWDWMSLHLDDGSKIMAFQMRLANQNDYITGTFIEADGSSQTLKGSDISLVALNNTRVGNKTFPLSWHLRIPHREIDITVESKKQDQWNPALFPYYEGAVNISGSHSGEGFLELTGY